MDKRADFLGDLAEVNDAMQDVGSIIAAAKSNAKTQTIDVESRPAKAAIKHEHANAVEPTKLPRPTRPRTRPEVEAIPVLLNVTTRITRDTNEAITEASLRQRLKKLRPASRQDIIEEALCEWLRKHGYAPKRGVAQETVEPLENEA